jgi:hypothetical protein
MPKMSEPRQEASGITGQLSAMDVLRRAGLDPARLSPIERDYFEISLSRQMPLWKAAGRPVELEAARWLEAKLAQKHDFLKSTDTSPADLRNAQADLRHVHERVLALEKDKLVASKTGKFPYGMMQRQVEELRKMGIDDPYKSTWEQRRIAGINSLYKNPFTTREGREMELAAQKRRDALVKEQTAQLGPRKENPFSDEYRLRNLASVHRSIMDDKAYREALEDQNSRFPENRKTPANMINDAIALVRNPKADLGQASPKYARAVRDYSRVLGIYSRDRELGREAKERMVAGLVAQEREMRIAMAEVASKSAIARVKARPREAEAVVYRYQFKVEGLGSEEKSTTYEFSSNSPIDSKAFRHALDAPSPEEARRNLAALGVSGLTSRAIAEMRDGVIDPLARTGFAEISAKKSPRN